VSEATEQPYDLVIRRAHVFDGHDMLMSGFDAAKVDSEFLPDSAWRANFLCGIGHGDPTKVLSRLPRLEFEYLTQTY
jgi:hypothetical protein